MPRSVSEWIGRDDNHCAPGKVQYGRWSVIGEAPRTPSGKIRLLCRCECGTERFVLETHLENGRTKSCGCLRLKKERTVHDHPLYSTYCNIIQRCENTNCHAYENYGGRGITMCQEWRGDFWQFVADMGERPTAKHTVERVNNDLGYSPANCVWARRATQMRNTRRTHFVTYRGRRMALVEACNLSGVKYGTAKWRLRNGVPEERAFDAT